MNYAIMITLTRVASVPVICLLYSLGFKVMSVVVFALSAMTDWLDGYIARKMLLESVTGAWLDFSADKIILITGLFLVAHAAHDQWVLMCCIVISVREIMAVSIRGWLADSSQTFRLSVSLIAKLKTAVQFTSIVLILLLIDTDYDLALYFAWIMFYLSVVLTVYSLYDYAVQCWNLSDMRE